jgi:uncharacterized Zn finger protein (UPF0148 family)
MSTCRRCSSTLLYRDAEGDVCCTTCGHVSVLVPAFVLEEVEREEGQPQRRGRKPTHGGMTI